MKDLPSAPRSRVLDTRWSARGRVDLVETPALHSAPGLSLQAAAPLPPQDGLFVDGHLVAAVDRGPSDWLPQSVGHLPRVLVPHAREVVLLGMGEDLPRATTVVDADPDLLALSCTPARRVVAAPRDWLRPGLRAARPADVVLVPVSRLDPVHESPMLTVEALREALAAVRPRGAVALSCPIVAPPREALKVLATAEAATPHVVAARSLDRLTVVLLPRAPASDDLAMVHAFCNRWGFDVVRPLAERPDRPRHSSAFALLPPGEDYPYDVSPATDARPYFHRFFRWSRLGDLVDREAVPFVEWGFVAVLAAFVEVLLLALLLLAAPLAVSRAARAPAPLFLALGAGFMLLEMAFLATATVRLGNPTVAAAAVLGGFLLGCGAGSERGERWGRPLCRAALVGGVLAVPWVLLLGAPWLSPGPLGVALLAAAAAFPLGMPFPAALARLPPASVPWALAVNGSASVAAAAGAPLLSSSLSIPWTAGIGAALYLLVALLAHRETPAAA